MKMGTWRGRRKCHSLQIKQFTADIRILQSPKQVTRRRGRAHGVSYGSHGNWQWLVEWGRGQNSCPFLKSFSRNCCQVMSQNRNPISKNKLNEIFLSTRCYWGRKTDKQFNTFTNLWLVITDHGDLRTLCSFKWKLEMITSVSTVFESWQHQIAPVSKVYICGKVPVILC